MIEIIQGDITKSNKDIIVQQVNTLGVMGAGLARTIAHKYPQVPIQYKAYIQEQKEKGVTGSDLLGQVCYVTLGHEIIANVFGQVRIASRSSKEQQTVPEKLIEGIIDIRNLAQCNGLSVAIPTHIGCGLANGNWLEIKPAIEAVFEDSGVNVQFYNFK